MWVRLEKINHVQGLKRFYVLSLTQTLFGEWSLTREWGRIGASGGQRKVSHFDTLDEAKSVFNILKANKEKRGYSTLPVQMQLFSAPKPRRLH
ncbi:WGR domain-containing protein [Cochlodiniinecator piscidefendens]|uniref:WGR domain-containing protein n=1 Tax=Cochlodiniinecator piscidefendens TaxID=2715756 RepID=UPI00140E189A|nr:WGR domain-containing protein [Cochlodiniinecator piscidefendens]